jgi:DNA-binding beta-propeller fold protein YncE
MKRTRWIVVGSICLASVGFIAAQDKGGEDLTGPYDVVENWMKPLPWHKGWTFGLIAGVFAETADRVFVLTGGELPEPRSAAAPIGRGQPSNANHRPGNFVLVLNRNGELVENWTQWDKLFVRPHKVTINPYDPERHIWIIDDWAQQIFKFTHDGKRLVMTLGEKAVTAEDRTHFGRPTDIAWNPDGTFWVSDGYVNGRVVKFDGNGKFLASVGKKGTGGPGEFNLVHCVAVDGRGRLYVADRDNRRIQVFDSNGTFIEMWTGIRRPSHLYVTQDQFIWMSDGEISRMVKYDLNGKLITYWGAQGAFPGAFNNNHNFSVDPDGNLYVADYQNYRVQKFTPKPGADRSRLIGPRFVSGG